jgi:hypothetical protein
MSDIADRIRELEASLAKWMRLIDTVAPLARVPGLDGLDGAYAIAARLRAKIDYLKEVVSMPQDR